MRFSGPRRPGHRAAGEAAFLALISALAVAASCRQASAQAPDSFVAYVESVSGTVIATSDGGPRELDVLDPISDGTRLALGPGAELRVCHYRTGTLITLKGPEHGVVSAASVTTQKGDAVASSKEKCSAPVVSTVQGGLALRSISRATDVGLRPRIRIISTRPIRRALLRDDAQKIIATFDRRLAQPQLLEGQSYVLVIDFADGTDQKMTLRASAAAATSTVIVAVK